MRTDNTYDDGWEIFFIVLQPLFCKGQMQILSGPKDSMISSSTCDHSINIIPAPKKTLFSQQASSVIFSSGGWNKFCNI